MTRRYQYPSITKPLTTTTATARVSEWGQPSTQPYPSILFSRRPATYYPSFFWAPPAEKNASDIGKWQQPSSQPYPFRLALSRALQPEPVWNVPSKSDVFDEGRWHQPISQPYPYLRALPRALHPEVPWNVAPVTTRPNEWYPVWHQPYPIKQNSATYVSALTWAGYVPIIAPLTFINWLSIAPTNLNRLRFNPALYGSGGVGPVGTGGLPPLVVTSHLLTSLGVGG